MDGLTDAALKAFPNAKYIQIYKGPTLVGGVMRMHGVGNEAYQMQPWMPPVQYDANADVLLVELPAEIESAS